MHERQDPGTPRESRRLRWHGTGTVRGVIDFAPKGENGFGYDPVFYYPKLRKHFAELRPDEKNAVSHQGLNKNTCPLPHFCPGRTALVAGLAVR
ncbi:hypothetical protein D4R89_08500 [bacterium]|nr:MAG: hypothetical protein D4R89_08500 [bacterium]